MSGKIRGIVLSCLKYSETSLILKIYTDKLGLQSYIVNIGTRNKNLRAGFFQPLFLIELQEASVKQNNLRKIGEVKFLHPFYSIPFDVKKSSIIIFLQEILLKSFHEGDANPRLFDFIFNALVVFDNATVGYSSFHLFFLIHLSAFLGFQPQNNYSSEKQIFDLCEATYQSVPPPHAHYADAPESRFISEIQNTGINNFQSLIIPYQTKKNLLNLIITYYKIHIANLSTLNSLHILDQLWSTG